MSLRALLLLVLAAASCDAYAPSFTACTVQCGPGGACPGGWECAADSYCHPAGDGALCACADACTAAAAQCVGNGRQRCVAGAGCRQWGALEACPPAAPYCSGAGQCGASCEDECAAGTRRCTSGGYQGCGTSAGHPCLGWSPEVGCASGEVCRAADGACVADCGGQPCPCRAGETQACADRGECRGGVRQCVDGEFGPCEWQVGPTPEECDGKDNDCNGTPDDGLAAPVCGEQRGVCAGAFERCGGAAGWVGCTAADYAAHAASQSHTYQGTESLCDGEDNDCDGTVDEPTQCCQPDCAGKACGADDGCGHPCPTGSCGANASCVSGACQCVNASCGGSCCGAGQVCAGTTCCTPSCNGKACGADDGCGRPCQTGSCGPAPAATCLNATTLRTYSGAGTCAGGTCSYTSTDTSCANGCSNGACTAAVTCSAGMVLIPAGPFMMGSAAGAGQTDEQPLHQVTLSGYCLDVTEVTNGQWRACVSGGGCAAPADSSSYTRSSYYGNATYDNYPVINIDWNQAQAYCAWAGKRLPTEAEWEKGARGGCEVVAPASCGGEDDRLYPWGDGAPTCSLANYYGCDGDTDSVGARPSGASPYGLKDMAGNVWEWVADWYSASYYGTSPSSDPSGPASGTARVLRGGSWNNDTNNVRVANRNNDDPANRNNDVGVRCASTPGARPTCGSGPPRTAFHGSSSIPAGVQGRGRAGRRAGGRSHHPRRGDLVSRSSGGTPPPRVPVAVEQAYDLALWVLERVRRYPRPWQSTLGTWTAESALGLTLSLVDASYRRDKEQALTEANTAAQRLRYLLRMAADLRVLAPAQLGFAAERVDEVGRMIGGWLRHCRSTDDRRDLRADRELREPAPGGARGGAGQAPP